MQAALDSKTLLLPSEALPLPGLTLAQDHGHKWNVFLVAFRPIGPVMACGQSGIT